jgi:hypothetical protein
MKIKELIELLQKHPNQNADIEIIANPSIGGIDDELDTEYHYIEVWNTDNFNEKNVTLFTCNQ